MEFSLNTPDDRDIIIDFTPAVYKESPETLSRNSPQLYNAEITIHCADIGNDTEEDAGSITASMYYPMDSSADACITLADDRDAFTGYAMTALAAFLDEEDYLIPDFQCIFIVQEIKAKEKYRDQLLPVIAEHLDEILREAAPLMKTFAITGAFDESGPVSEAFRDKGWRIIDTPDSEDESCTLSAGYTPQRDSVDVKIPGFAEAANLSEEVSEYLAVSEAETLHTMRFIKENDIGTHIADIAVDAAKVTADALAAQLLAIKTSAADHKDTINGFYTDWQRIVRHMRHMAAACGKEE